MGTVREHLEELRDINRWVFVRLLSPEPPEQGLGGVVTRRCPLCAALIADSVEDMHLHGQWHASHIVAHSHDESVPSSAEHPAPG